MADEQHTLSLSSASASDEPPAKKHKLDGSSSQSTSSRQGAVVTSSEKRSRDERSQSSTQITTQGMFSRSLSPVRGNDERRKVSPFFKDIIDTFFPQRGDAADIKTEHCEFIVVGHIVPTLPHFLVALQLAGKVAVIIPKSSKANEKVLRQIQTEGFTLLKEVADLDKKKKRRWFYYEKNVFSMIEEYVTKESNFLVIDIGGYFAPCQDKLKGKYGGRFLGIVEDTENGHDKYEKTLRTLKERDVPCASIISVARCKLKETEDYNVGKSIVEASDTILRTDSHSILERMRTVGVIGFGKIGSSIAEHLRQKNVRNVVVYDIDPIRQMKACSYGFTGVGKHHILNESEMIFCATGKQSLEGVDFFSMQDNVFIASCTSADDEFNMQLLRDMAGESDVKDNVSKFRLSDKKVVNILREGDAVNFTFDAVNGPYIYSVQASLIVAASYLTQKKIVDDKQVNMFGDMRDEDRKDMQRISLIWLKHFENYESEHVLASFNTGHALNILSELSPVADIYFDIAMKVYKEHEENDKLYTLFIWLAVQSSGQDEVQSRFNEARLDAGSVFDAKQPRYYLTCLTSLHELKLYHLLYTITDVSKEHFHKIFEESNELIANLYKLRFKVIAELSDTDKRTQYAKECLQYVSEAGLLLEQSKEAYTDLIENASTYFPEIREDLTSQQAIAEEHHSPSLTTSL